MSLLRHRDGPSHSVGKTRVRWLSCPIQSHRQSCQYPSCVFSSREFLVFFFNSLEDCRFVQTVIQTLFLLRSASVRSPPRTIHKSLSVLTVSPFDDKEAASECNKMVDQGTCSLLSPELGFKASSSNVEFRLISTPASTKPLVNKGSVWTWELFAI